MCILYLLFLVEFRLEDMYWILNLVEIDLDFYVRYLNIRIVFDVIIVVLLNI